MTDVFRTVSMSNPAYEHENLRTITVRSPALGSRGDVSVWSAPRREVNTLLILLHGVYGSHWSWALEGGVHRTAQHLLSSDAIAPLVIAMPSDGLLLDGSAYLTYPGAADYERWIVEEVPHIARLAVPGLQSNANIILAGLSMGGYGALRLGAKYPERFRGISTHSAITDISEMSIFVPDLLDVYLHTAPREELSAIYWLRKNRHLLPPVRFDCGFADPLIEGNRALHTALQDEKIAHVYEELAGGHEWSYWRQNVERTLLFASSLERA